MRGVDCASPKDAEQGRESRSGGLSALSLTKRAGSAAASSAHVTMVDVADVRVAVHELGVDMRM